MESKKDIEITGKLFYFLYIDGYWKHSSVDKRWLKFAIKVEIQQILDVLIRNCPAFKISTLITTAISSFVKLSKGTKVVYTKLYTHKQMHTPATFTCTSLLPSRFPCLEKNHKYRNKSWFDKHNRTISLHKGVIGWLIVISFFCYSDPLWCCQKCSSRAPAQTTSGWLDGEMVNRVFFILDHSHIAGLSSVPLDPAALFITSAPTIPMAEPSIGQNVRCGVNPKIRGRWVTAMQHQHTDMLNSEHLKST